MEKGWTGANVIENLSLNDTGGKPTYKIEVRSLWDNEFLYISFVCQDEDIWATYKNLDDPIFLEEAVGMFIDANSDPKSYAEFAVNPTQYRFFSICSALSGRKKI